MTISTTQNQLSYVGDGVSLAFAFPFPFIATTDLKVLVGGVLQTVGYAVAGLAPVTGSGTFANGTVTFVSPPALGATILIYCDPDQLQSTSLPPNDPFPSKTVEKMIDKVTLLIQRLATKFGNALTFPIGEANSGVLPAAAARANTLLGFDANSNPAVLFSLPLGAFTNGAAFVDGFTGNGVQTAFTLGQNPGSQNNLGVAVGGVIQRNGIDFTWAAGTIITFTTAPPNGVSVQVRYTNAIPVGSVDSSSVSFVSGLTGAVPETLQSRGRLVVWSATFGHSPSASAAANDTALIAAMTAVYNAGGGTVLIGPGTFQHVTAAFAWAANTSVNLVGSGKTATVLQKSGATSLPVLNFSQQVGVLDTYSTFANFSILGNAKGCPGLRATLLARCELRSVRITACDVGLDLVGSLIWDHFDLSLIGNNIGVRTRKSGAIYANLHNFFGGEQRANSTNGFDFGEGSAIHLYGVDLESNGTTLNTATGNGVIRSTVSAEIGYATISFNGCWMEASLGTNLTVEASGLALSLRNCVLAGNEAGRAAVVGAIQSLDLDNVQCGSPGDVITTAAASCFARGGVIATLTDTGATHCYINLSTLAGVTAFDSGSSSGRVQMKNGSINSGSGSQASTTAVAVTLFSALPFGLYLVYAALPNAGTAFQATARVLSDGTNAQRIEGTNGANMTITVSGSNVQATQTTGAGQNISYVYERIA